MSPVRSVRSPLSDTNRIVIVGGGIAGLAAAVELTSHNIPTELLEQRHYCGGRAYSFRDKETGDIVDNGQHVLIAGYGRTLRFLKRIGTDHLVTIQEQPSFLLHHPKRGICEFRLPKLPSPLHLISGILTTNLFSFRDKLAMLRAGAGLQRPSSGTPPDELTIDQWLDSIGQSSEAKLSFWEPLAISIMNEHIARASAKVFVHTLRQAFLGGWKNSALAIPTVGLSELYVGNAVKFIRNHGGEVQVNADVTDVLVENGTVKGVKCKDNREFPSTAVILAVPHYRVAGICNPEFFHPKNVLPCPQKSLQSTPIVSVHLWFERDFMPHEFIGVIGRRIQWIFNKRKLFREQRTDGHISCVISAAHEFVDMSNEELARIALVDLRSVYPDTPPRPTSSVCVREKRATFSCTPGVENARPSNATSLANLFLAGDWTNTGLPATIEGAVMSGENCAELAMGLIRRE